MSDQDIKSGTEMPHLLKLVSQIVSAYVSNNTLTLSDLPDFIRSVHDTLNELESGGERTSNRDLTPVVPIKKSVTPDYIICLEDGKKLKMLKRYLRSQYGMSPEDYRARWGLPPDYPMVAPNYASQRSRLAKQIGLGKAATSGSMRARKKK
ncbi:MAG: MucR family transcriptional regulator [Parvibaculum sp.]|nr:MucR family transcriptional regulator [Parvibaculum sp.]